MLHRWERGSWECARVIFLLSHIALYNTKRKNLAIIDPPPGDLRFLIIKIALFPYGNKMAFITDSLWSTILSFTS